MEHGLVRGAAKIHGGASRSKQRCRSLLPLAEQTEDRRHIQFDPCTYESAFNRFQKACSGGRIPAASTAKRLICSRAYQSHPRQPH
jgi:hypothetical protein